MLNFHDRSLAPSSSRSQQATGGQLSLPPAPAVCCLSSPLVEKGLASVRDGRLVITDQGIDRFGQILQARRTQGSERRNTAWTGKIIFDLAHLVSNTLESQESLPSAKQLYRAFFRMGHRISPGQFNYGLGIFAKCENALEVHATLSTHQSHGVWWASLTPREKLQHTQARQEAQRRFWERLSPEERDARKDSAAQALRVALTEARGHAEGAQYARANEISLALKAIERGLTPGGSIQFPNLAEPMRSSWEALFARVVASCKDRFYIYEPMGFPLIDPRTGRVEVYHPDFFDYKCRNGENIVRVIEIKGLLTPTGRRKIELFEKYYLHGDFSEVPESRRELLRNLVATAKTHAEKQFQLDLTPGTAFRVFGELYWSRSQRNFVAENSARGQPDKMGRGLIPRLARRFPELVPSERAPAFSRRELKRSAESFGMGQEALISVQPIQNAPIKRSIDIPLTAYTLTRLYALMSVVHDAQRECVDRGLILMTDPDPLTTIFNLTPIFDMATTWHGTDPSQKRKLIENYERRLKKPQDYLSVYTGNVYLKLIRDTFFEGLMFTFPEQISWEESLFATIRLNAQEIGARLTVLEGTADRKLKRAGADQSQLNELKRTMVSSANELVNSFGERLNAGQLPLDLPYISQQFVSLLRAGYPSPVYVYPQRGSRCPGELQLLNEGIAPDSDDILGRSDKLLVAHRMKFGAHSLP